MGKFTCVLLLLLRMLLSAPQFQGPPPSLGMRVFLRPVQLVMLGIGAAATAVGLHVLCVQCEAQPSWLWGGQVWESALVALDAETGAYLWNWKPPEYSLLATVGDQEQLLQRLWVGKGDPLCLPDSWSQNTISADGTVYAGFANGHVYAVRDEDGNGRITGKEVSAYNFGQGFQASHGLAPGLLAIVPCGGGLYVWRY